MLEFWIKRALVGGIFCTRDTRSYGITMNKLCVSWDRGILVIRGKGKGKKEKEPPWWCSGKILIGFNCPQRRNQIFHQSVWHMKKWEAAGDRTNERLCFALVEPISAGIFWIFSGTNSTTDPVEKMCANNFFARMISTNVSIINSSPTKQSTINLQRGEANIRNSVFDGKMSTCDFVVWRWWWCFSHRCFLVRPIRKLVVFLKGSVVRKGFSSSDALEQELFHPWRWEGS